jgi:hypothetical protein
MSSQVSASGIYTATRLKRSLTTAVLSVVVSLSVASAQTARWPEQKANAWYGRQPWLIGSNYVPKSAINQLEMWQEATFDPVEIDKELAWAEAMGMNTMRVFLHDLLWQQDSWQHPYILDQPPVWFHEVLRPDGTPYREAEVNLIRQLTGKQ